jgi:hypothetical protein
LAVAEQPSFPSRSNGIEELRHGSVNMVVEKLFEAQRFVLERDVNSASDGGQRILSPLWEIHKSRIFFLSRGFAGIGLGSTRVL